MRLHRSMINKIRGGKGKRREPPAGVTTYIDMGGSQAGTMQSENGCPESRITGSGTGCHAYENGYQIII